MPQSGQFTKHELLQHCGFIGLIDVTERNTKAQITSKILNYHIRNSHNRNDNDTINNKKLNDTINIIQNNLLQMRNSLQSNVKDLEQFKFIHVPQSSYFKSNSFWRRSFCIHIMYFLIILIISYAFWIRENKHSIRIRSISWSYAHLRNKYNYCLNKAVLYDPLQVHRIQKERDQHLQNLGITQGILENSDRPYWYCYKCHINLWTVNKLIRLCEKKYHSDLYARYNDNKDISNELKKEYDAKFMNCTQARKFFQNESLVFLFLILVCNKIKYCDYKTM